MFRETEEAWKLEFILHFLPLSCFSPQLVHMHI